MITKFMGEHQFLSNFASTPFMWEGVMYSTAEHAFQASKAMRPGERTAIVGAKTPAEAKRLGRKATLYPGWEAQKYEIMHKVVQAKFYSDRELQQGLLATGNEILVEGNTWHDQTWGDCTCPQHKDTPGLNALGTILMQVRLELIAARERGDLDE